MKHIDLSLAVLQHERETGLGAFAGLLDRAGVHHELLTTSDARLPDAAEFDGVLVLGGSLAADDPALLETRRWIRNAALSEVPILGVCLGGQLLATALGGSVGPALCPEIGVHDVFRIAKDDPLFSGLPGRFTAFGWHEDEFQPRRAPFRSPDRSHVSIRRSALGRTPTVCNSTLRCGQRTSSNGPPFGAMRV